MDGMRIDKVLASQILATTVDDENPDTGA
jgi:hypothetical protein